MCSGESPSLLVQSISERNVLGRIAMGKEGRKSAHGAANQRIGSCLKETKTSANQKLKPPQQIYRGQVTYWVKGSVLFCFENCIPEGRGREKAGSANFKTKHSETLVQEID